MSITVLNPGIMTSVQDLGRTGYQQFGVPVSGVMDPHSARLANLLVDNDENEAVLECTMMGLTLRFDVAEIIAVTGGDLGATLDGKPMPLYKAVKAEAGQVLRFLMPKSGCRAYIAFAGGLDIPEVMGSRSTYMKAKIGGFKGRKLEKDDVLAFRAAKTELPMMESRVLGADFLPEKQYVIHVVMGPQDDMFTDEGIKTFLNEVYSVTAEFDRMGCRLDGAVIEHKNGGDIISDGISFGAIQVPTAGKPIIMLADRQTTGGYTKIANVITADFRILGQLKGGDKVHFVKVSVEEAQMLLKLQRDYYRMVKEFFGRDK